jgi:hypothetical protein
MIKKGRTDSLRQRAYRSWWSGEIYDFYCKNKEIVVFSVYLTVFPYFDITLSTNLAST